MKTRRRVKRTVREMPRRLTIRLSKGSNRNMVEGPGKAMPSSPRTKQFSDGPLRQHQPGKESKFPTEKKTPFQSSHHRGHGRGMIAKRATGGSPKTPDLPGTDGFGGE